MVLVAGLGRLRSVTLDARGLPLVAGEGGAWVIEPSGAARKVADGAVLAASAHPDATYLLRPGSLELHSGSPAQAPGFVAPARTFPADDAFDALAVGAPGEVWLLTPAGFEALDTRSGDRRPILAITDARAFAWTPDGVLLLTPTTLSRVAPDGSLTVLRGGFVEATAVAAGPLVADRRGVWRVEDPPVLLTARIDHVPDLQPAHGPPGPPGSTLLVEADGRVELLPPR